MEAELEKYRQESLVLCEKLLGALNANREYADAFFGGEINKAYDAATEKAINKAKRIRTKIRNL